MTEPTQPQNSELLALREENASLRLTIQSLQRQIDWFQRQLFGRKSERLQTLTPEQIPLFPSTLPAVAEPPSSVTVGAHQRRKKAFPGTPEDSGLRFDETRVPMQVIDLAPAVEAERGEYEIVRYESTYRLAQRPASYVVLKYRRPVIKYLDEQTLVTTPAPANVFEKSVADVSFLANLIVDKFLWHLPLYRQHQRLQAGHIQLSRSVLTQWVHRCASLLEPIAKAVLQSILESRVLAMDETPIRAGHTKKPGQRHGQMKSAYFWPMMGDRDEIYFHFAPSRAHQHGHDLLKGFQGVLVSDGYSAYSSYAAAVEGVDSAQCWAHCRRGFDRALDYEPALATEALQIIASLYQVEAQIVDTGLQGAQKREMRQTLSTPIVDNIITWCKAVAERSDLIALSSPIVVAANYIIRRETALRLYLNDPDVPIDTNHLERRLRVIPMGRNAWLFCWTEIGAHYVGVLQTLLSSCRLQGIDPYTYLVDVLQRVDRHPASAIEQLTPRLWKQHFADNPLRSDLDTS